MGKILKKEMRLSASVLSYLFILFGFMFFLPGYPILCGPFFVTLGIFQSFQNARETGDIVFSALLPIAKKDVVKGKYVFVCFVESCAFLLMAVVTLLRMTVFSNATVYRANALMTANPFALGMALLIFGLFNLIFVGGFFKTAYKFAKPFVIHIVVTFLVIIAVETSHHLPGFSALNAFGFEHMGLQLSLLFAGAAAYVVLTVTGMKGASRNIVKLDL